MPKYIALLRAINVSGSKIIKMEDLRKIFEALKFKNVQTYIQSGNVIFEAKETDKKILRQKIEKHLAKSLGFDVTTIIRTLGELEAIVKHNPFRDEQIDKEHVVYVAFMSEEPSKEKQQWFTKYHSDVDVYGIVGEDLFCLCHKLLGKSLFANSLVEKMGIDSTTRNLNTVFKLLEML